jgi:peroxiredoxin
MQRVEALRAEARNRFPRGLIAQGAKLDAAGSEEDPVLAAALYRKFMDEFPENVSWTQLAASKRFKLMARHPELFTLDELVVAAEQFDALSEPYIAVYGNPTIRLHALTRIGAGILKRDPSRSITFADRGIRFVESTAASTEEFDLEAADSFWAIKLIATAKLGQSSKVLQIAEVLLPDPETGKGVVVNPWLPIGEAELRIAYSKALAAEGQIMEAWEQVSFAAALDPLLAAERASIFQRDQLTDKERLALDDRVSFFLDRRTDFRRRQVLAMEQWQPAPEFSLHDVDGQVVSLEDFRGRLVVLDFWATWCSPCIAQMKALKKAKEERYPDSAIIEFIAVSIDIYKDKVPLFVEKHELTCRVLYGDGKVDADYLETDGIPQLFIIDRDGYIRFHVIGFDGSDFPQRLDWMVDAAQKGHS